MPRDLSCDINNLCVYENKCLKLTRSGKEGSEKWRKKFLRACSHCAASGNGIEAHYWLSQSLIL